MDMISIIEKYLNKKAEINFQPIQLGDVTDTYADIDQTSKLIDYSPKTDISEGIPKFIDWYKTYYKID